MWSRRAPVTLRGVAGSQLLVLLNIAISGLTAHVMAEALLNAPRLLQALMRSLCQCQQACAQNFMWSCRAAVTLSGVAGSQLMVLPSIAISGLTAHVMAEALLNAPRLLGSLELLGNPAGLVHSLAEGLQDFLSLSLAARSPSTVGRPSTVGPFLAWLRRTEPRQIRVPRLACPFGMLSTQCPAQGVQGVLGHSTGCKIINFNTAVHLQMASFGQTKTSPSTAKC